MNRKPPSLRKHKTGQWFCRWAGKDHYFGMARAVAKAKYLGNLKQWAEWRAERDSQRPPVQILRGPIMFSELVESFLRQKENEGGPARRRYYHNHLKRAVDVFANHQASEIRTGALNAFKQGLIATKSYGPKTIQHDLGCVKSVLQWGSSLELIPAVNLSAVKAPVLAPTSSKAYSREQVWTFVSRAGEVGPLLVLQYLGLMRPSEVPRLVFGEGEWERPFLYRMQSKNQWRTREPRLVVVTEPARLWLKRCPRRWHHPSSYYHAAVGAVPGMTPHRLRHSAATHLEQEGVPRADIDALLGHLPTRVSRTYNAGDWQRLERHVRLISASPWPRP